MILKFTSCFNQYINESNISSLFCHLPLVRFAAAVTATLLFLVLSKCNHNPH